MVRMKSYAVASAALGVFLAACDRPSKQPELNAQPAPPVASTDTGGAATNGATPPAGKASVDTGAANRQPSVVTGAANRPPSIVNRSSRAPQPGSTLLGVYTAEQATEGYDVYLGNCNSCHAGLGNHAGAVFRATWGDRSLADMFYYIAENMPKSAPGSLSAEDNVRVMAYLLKVNEMPAGKVALPTDPAELEKLWFDTTTVTKKND